MTEPGSVTRILNSIEQGDAQAAEELLPLVYRELRRLAARRLAKEKEGQTPQATALVHEAYLRLVENAEDRHWNSRGHFFAAAAAMRRILVDTARRKKAQVHGGKLKRAEADIGELDVGHEIDDRVLEVDEALQRLAENDPQKAEFVKLRFFAGLTVEQAADSLGISTATAGRDWRYARAWLNHELSSGD